ncbi:MAG: hypothetical protein C7B46_20125 [Sulfobacillus benefaciens]|jgi:hypothetical protein|uniref:Uncharacterized protein n=1 Tax=Sulfobacillus benefaciens TaxID=453960 RepID=A0A2T2WVI6_9FIRM|nr:MAG: hypothetical protein C7B46_20125 [Sulfobacillus benefaciens]
MGGKRDTSIMRFTTSGLSFVIGGVNGPSQGSLSVLGQQGLSPTAAMHLSHAKTFAVRRGFAGYPA